MPARSLSRHLMRVLVNPAVALVLRSRVHGALSGSLLLLTLQGRKSRRWHTLPVQYAQGDGLIYVQPGAHAQKTWWRNLVGGAPISLRMRGRVLEGEAEVLRGGSNPESVIAGLRVYFDRFPQSARLRGIHRMPDGSFDPEGVRAAARDMILVRIRLVHALGEA